MSFSKHLLGPIRTILLKNFKGRSQIWTVLQLTTPMQPLMSHSFQNIKISSSAMCTNSISKPFEKRLPTVLYYRIVLTALGLGTQPLFRHSDHWCAVW